MPFPGIARGLAALGRIYAKWKGAEWAIDRPDTLAEGGISDAVAVRTDMRSSAIEWIQYNPLTAKLLVRFRNRPQRPTYVFSSVPRLVWLAWLRAGSKGVYYHRSVKQHSDRIR